MMRILSDDEDGEVSTYLPAKTMVVDKDAELNSVSPATVDKTEERIMDEGDKEDSGSSEKHHEIDSSDKLQAKRKVNRMVIEDDDFDGDNNTVAVNAQREKSSDEPESQSNKSKEKGKRRLFSENDSMSEEKSNNSNQADSQRNSYEAKKKEWQKLFNCDEDEDSDTELPGLSPEKALQNVNNGEDEEKNRYSSDEDEEKNRNSSDDEGREEERNFSDDDLHSRSQEVPNESDEESRLHDNTTKAKNKNKNKNKKEGDRNKDEKLKIYSETQRLLREKPVSLPYHKPKQRSLREFLSRRKKTVTNVTLSSSSKKMVEVWKEIEESTQNVFEFFKSDSEDERDCSEEKSPVEVEMEQIKEKDVEDMVVDPEEKSEKKTEELENGFCSIVSAEVDKNGEDNLSVEKVEEKLIEVNSKNLEENLDGTEKELAETENDCNEKELKECANDCNEKELKGSANDCNEKGLKESANDCNEKESTSVENLNNRNGNDITETAEQDKIEDSLNKEEETVNESSIDRTTDWLKDLIEYEKKQKHSKKEKLVEKINPKLLSFTPRLTGGPDSFIDLSNDGPDLTEGAKKLMDRFIQNCIIPKRKNPRKSEVEMTLSRSETNEKGEIMNLVTEKLTYVLTEDPVEDSTNEKPGAKLQRLKTELENRISAKWEEEHLKKMSEAKSGFEDEAAEDFDEEDEEEILDDSEDSESESEPEENDIEIVDKKKDKNKFIDSEAEVSADEGGDEMEDDDDDDDDEGDKSEEEEEEEEKDNEDDNQKEDEDEKEDEDRDEEEMECSLFPAYQPGGGLLHGGSDLTQREDTGLPSGLLSPSMDLENLKSPAYKTIASSPAEVQTVASVSELTPECIGRRKLFSDMSQTDQFDINDAFEFCSGKFPESQAPKSQYGPMEEGAIAKLVGKYSGESSMEDFASGSFGTQPEIGQSVNQCLAEGWKDTGVTQTKRIILPEDEDSNQNGFQPDEELEVAAAKLVSSDEELEDSTGDLSTAKNKKNKKKLKFSDDEGDGENEDNDSEDEAEPEPQEAESEIEAEAEETNRVVEYDSEENEIVKVNPNEFFENEAELSESEWSGDEDEHGLDVLDMEAGDAEQLDNDQVRSQLEKIHMRRVLDDDKREVRLLQELFFEDGDLHSDGKRERKFKWKNLSAFDNDDGRQAESGDESQGEDGENEEQMRKMRHERALFLMEQQKKENIISDDEGKDEENSLLKLGMTMFKKSVKITSEIKNKIIEEDSAESIKRPFALFNKRGSFLSRNEQFLSRLAKYTSGNSDNILGPKHSKNFVFASKSPEKTDAEPETLMVTKRKNVSFTGTAPKKPKLSANAKLGPSLLDQLA